MSGERISEKSPDLADRGKGASALEKKQLPGTEGAREDGVWLSKKRSRRPSLDH